MLFHFANRRVKGQETRVKGQGLIALSTSEPQIVQNLRTFLTFRTSSNQSAKFSKIYDLSKYLRIFLFFYWIVAIGTIGTINFIETISTNIIYSAVSSRRCGDWTTGCGVDNLFCAVPGATGHHRRSNGAMWLRIVWDRAREINDRPIRGER